jgi:hypothetical protein
MTKINVTDSATWQLIWDLMWHFLAADMAVDEVFFLRLMWHPTWHFLPADVAIFFAADIAVSFSVTEVDNDVTYITHSPFY